MLKLITIYMTGKDYAEALIWSHKAAELGNVAGQYSLGAMYLEGLGVPKDKAQALAWLQKAASQRGFLASMARKSIDQLEIAGAPPTPPPADFDAMRQQAEQGNAEAQNNLGVIFQDDRSVLKDYAQAAAWFRKAAEQGNATAEANLAEMYFDGKGVPRDFAHSAAWFRKAAEHGDARS